MLTSVRPGDTGVLLTGPAVEAFAGVQPTFGLLSACDLRCYELITELEEGGTRAAQRISDHRDIQV